MRPDGGHGRQRPVEGLAGDVLFDMAVGLAPPERRADALAELARVVGLRRVRRSETARPMSRRRPSTVARWSHDLEWCLGRDSN